MGETIPQDPKFFPADKLKVGEFNRKMNLLRCTEEPI
jgi:hypothetical protein